jgi:hypothetical protein
MDEATPTLEETINQIVESVRKTTAFWSNHGGWAPPATADILDRAQLDWLWSLSMSLHHWNRDLSSGDLILAWANIGAIVEGYLKLFLSIYAHDYSNAPLLRRDRPIDQDVILLEALRVYFSKHVLAPAEDWDTWISFVQSKRNAIHAFRSRDIGDTKTLHAQIPILLKFVRDLDSRLPYP